MAGLPVRRGWRGWIRVCHEHVGGWFEEEKLGQSGFRGSDVEVCCSFA